MAVGTTDASRLGRFDYTGARSECGGHGIDFGAKNKAGAARLHRASATPSEPYTNESAKTTYLKCNKLLRRCRCLRRSGNLPTLLKAAGADCKRSRQV
jgi:hypothetical protein